MKKTLFLTFSFTLFLLSLQGQIISDFTNDTDNWHSEGDGDYFWEAETGNPGGCFRVDDDATGDINYAYAPSKFLGDWTSATSDDSLSADIFLHRNNGGYLNGYFVFKIKGPGGEALTIVDAQPPLDTWTEYSAHLNPAEWTMVSGDWTSLLQQVTDFIIRAEYINGDEYVRIDNVILSFSPVVIPVTPTICSDFDDGAYDGWSFVGTNGTNNTTYEERPGRSIKINDKSSDFNLAYPPPKYLGDWSQLDNHAAQIVFDLNIKSHAGSALTGDYFVRISGPDGSAIFPLNDNYLAAIGAWNTFVFPIEETFWTMESGTWSDLLSWINHMEIVLEFYDGTEEIWFDNFCISNLPPTADFSVESTVSFVGNPIAFYDNSQYGVTSWDWNFGNGQTSSDKNPVHTYQSSGTYDVGLEVSNHFGSDQLSEPDVIQILPVDQCLKFEDDFDDPEINPAWLINNGTWSISDGEMKQSSNYYNSDDYLDGCYALTGSLLWEDYLLSCDLYSTDNDYIGIVFNWQDEQNMSMFMWNRQENLRELVNWVDGEKIALATDNVVYSSNQWYNIRILSVDREITLVIDGEEIFSVTDDTFTAGKAGLYCWANQSSYWDNFRVECSDSEIITIPGGWSGISSYVVPAAANLESMFTPIISDLIILQNDAGIFWPGQNVNTLGDWNTHEGYQVKTANTVELTVSGTKVNNQTLQLVSGWNLIPVLSECAVDINTLFGGTDAILIKEVAGGKIFWPEFNINTLNILEPGKAYFVMMGSDAEILFPECSVLKSESSKENTVSSDGELDLPMYEEAQPTAFSHAVAIPSSVFKNTGIESGDLISACDDDEQYYGATIWKEKNISITLFGDDPTTPKKDGFSEGEPISFRIYRPATDQKTDLELNYSNRFNNSGLFQTNGMSVVSGITANLSDFGDLSGLSNAINIYPNPTQGIITIHGISEDATISVFDAFGNSIRQFEMLDSNAIELSSQAPGVYFIKIETKGNSHFEKLILN